MKLQIEKCMVTELREFVNNSGAAVKLHEFNGDRPGAYNLVSFDPAVDLRKLPQEEVFAFSAEVQGSLERVNKVNTMRLIVHDFKVTKPKAE